MSSFNTLIFKDKIWGIHIVIMIALLALGCGSNSNMQSTEKKPSDTQSAENFSAPLPTTLQRHLITGGKLYADLTIVYNKTGKVVVDKKQLDIVGNTVTGKIDKLTADASYSYTFTIDYYITRDNGTKVKIATGSTKHFVEATPSDKPRKVKIDTINYFDDDKDGFTNLAELELGTYTNPGEPGIRPNAELPRSSTNYILSDTMGINPTEGKTTVVGESKSANYTLY